MMTPQTMPATANSDLQLVEWSLMGDRDAFRQIVERYQALVCSITYNATGSLTLSQDLAQETFVAAWKQLSELREPAQLRTWLCGITRFLVGKELRRQGHEPIHAAEPFGAIHDSPSPDPSPSAQAVSREEEAILWRALEQIPDVYRQPLILFYREQQSIERVAVELDLSEDAVKQRLSRGRKLLHEEVIAFVEGTLTRTAPGQEFTGAVLAALPVAAGSAATAGAGLGAKGTAAAKSGGLLAVLGAWLVPVISVVGSLAAQWLIVRAAPTPRERRVKKLAFIALWTFALAWAWAGRLALRAWAEHAEWTDQTFFPVMAVFWWFYITVIATVIVVLFRQMLAIRRQTDKETGSSPTFGTPLTVGTRIAFVVGMYLPAFLWLINLAWRSRDLVSVGVFTGTMVALAVLHFFQFQGRTGVARARGGMILITLAWAVILVMLNCRLDVWMAADCGTDLAEIHRLLPTWIIPSLTAALVLWIGFILALTKPKPHS
jgi:RNA polymerase sigma factor (sigma-70 family)